MSTSDLLIIIPVITASILSIIGAVFAGYQSLQANHHSQANATKIAEVHTIVNSKSDQQLNSITALQEQVRELQAAAIAKSDAALSKAETRAGEHPQGE